MIKTSLTLKFNISHWILDLSSNIAYPALLCDMFVFFFKKLYFYWGCIRVIKLEFKSLGKLIKWFREWSENLVFFSRSSLLTLNPENGMLLAMSRNASRHEQHGSRQLVNMSSIAKVRSFLGTYRKLACTSNCCFQFFCARRPFWMTHHYHSRLVQKEPDKP